MKYTRLSHVEHIIKRPDTYVGSLLPESSDQWIRESDGFKISRISISPALVKIFDEILVNAIDQYSLNPKKIKSIKVDFSGGYTHVTNYGVSIPIQKHETEKDVWIPELIFGHLLTSSNYNDNEDRVTGGRNGYGAKLANVFSREFKLKINDGRRMYSQSWKKNMSICEPPEITESDEPPSVRISFKPDGDRLGTMNDWEKIIEKRTWDAAMWCSKASVEFNGSKLNVHSLEEYAKMHIGNVPVAKMHTENFDIVIGHSKNGFQQCSWVNGISTTKGGTHVEKVVKQVVDGILNSKNVTVKNFQVRGTLFVFIKSVIINPTFSSQTKAECTSKITETIEMKPKFIKDILSTGILEDLMALGVAKIDKELKKTDGTKKARISGIPKLDDANWAGTHKSHDCTLIVTEGDSAKTLAIAGLSVVGRNAYGVFPLRGKPRNVRDATVAQVTDNEEFSNIKKILGLQHGKIYNSLKELRYGRLMIMTDADLDGSHIKGLVLNMFHVYWPKLIELGFVVSMVTPVIKAGKQWYFSEDEFRQTGLSTDSVKYYKGLGTSTSSEAKEYFKQIDRLTVAFKSDQKMDESMQLAFARALADDRKVWLAEHMANPPKGVRYGHVNSLSVTDFVKNDMSNFSAEDIKRSIPHCVDGLKPSQRKVIYSCLKRNITKDIKVAQLSGYVAEQTAYHHGEASLQGTIVNLAQNFVGSNNLNLLVPSGQFGTRLLGGKDSASPRYINTRLAPITVKIFDPADNPVLKYVFDDGQRVEPEYYAPVIPMILVNGAEGIGTGFSCYVPPFDPDVIKHNIQCALKQVEMAPMVPHFVGFKGSIRKTKEHTWVLEGVYEVEGSQIKVTELPPGRWIQDFKEHLDDLVEKGVIQKYENHSTETTPEFRIWGATGIQDIPKTLGLTKTIHTSNMYLIGPNGAVKKYASPEEILVDYIEVRLRIYRLRKNHILQKIDSDIQWISEKARFIRDVAISKRIGVFNQSIETIKRQLKEEVYAEAIWSKLLETKTYEYTLEEVEKLQNLCIQKQNEREIVKGTTVFQMWEKNLREM